MDLEEITEANDSWQCFECESKDLPQWGITLANPPSLLTLAGGTVRVQLCPACLQELVKRFQVNR